MKVRSSRTGKTGTVIDRKVNGNGVLMYRIRYENTNAPVWGNAENFVCLESEHRCDVCGDSFEPNLNDTSCDRCEEIVIGFIEALRDDSDPDPDSDFDDKTITLSDMIALDRQHPPARRNPNPRKCPVRTVPSGCPIPTQFVSPAWNRYRLAWEINARYDILNHEIRSYRHLFPAKEIKGMLRRLWYLRFHYRRLCWESIRMSQEEDIAHSVFLPHVTRASPSMMWALVPGICDGGAVREI